MKTLVMIPTRGRPESLQMAAESVWQTSTATVVAYIDEDQEADYSIYTGQKIVGPRIGPVASANEIVKQYPDYSAYGLITDDAMMTVNGWDRWLNEALSQCPNLIGVVSPYHNQGNHVDMPFVSREWIEVVGWFAYPRCFHYCWPIITGLIGEMSAIIHAPIQCFSVYHPHKVEMVSVEKKQRDAQEFFEFVSLELPSVVERVRRAMGSIRTVP